ncbi:related to tubulin-specific chaperone e (tubulin folding cofactor E) [Rhynchosporium graminicola]|uniref:Related to tubulin-specific chaperone e (Tubulin folding cofactor E) n=1 Tax=Rhynchosporium graminicola TaxID=2792576 RepID=A0A1E1JY81_9HELO|nr:related to tubulin-specific chaperone e (tubulin folding cofactor E) [Rhynchosporium commune]
MAFIKAKDTSRVSHFVFCFSSSPTAASFILSSSRTADPEQSLVAAVREKYGSPATIDASEVNVVSGKTVEEVGFDKIRAQQGRLHELKIVLVDGQRISTAENSALEIRNVCPMIEELDLSRNLLSSLAEVARICTELDRLKSLRINGNRFSDVCDVSRLASDKPYVSAFPKVTELSMDEVLFDWGWVIGIVAQFQHLKSLEVSMNGFKHLQNHFISEGLTSITMEYNGFQSLTDVLVLQKLVSLEALKLKGNEISKIAEQPYEISELSAFGNQLTYVDLSNNAVSEWKFVDDLNHIFPGMTALRLSHNPIYKTSKDAGSFTSMDDSYMLTLARIRKLGTLNFSKISSADRINSEMFYLSQITKQISEAPESREKEVISQHPRFAELCESHGAPTIVRKEAGVMNPNFLEARLITFTFYLPPSSHEGQTEEIRMVREIPMSFDVYRVKGLVGRMFGIRPLSLRLIWETGEWDPVAGYEEWEEDDDEEEEEIDEETAAMRERGKWMKREVEIEDSTRRVGNLVDGMEAVVRLELR